MSVDEIIIITLGIAAAIGFSIIAIARGRSEPEEDPDVSPDFGPTGGSDGGASASDAD